MRKIKLVIIGAGSTYTPELIEGLIKRKNELCLSELALMDIDQNKLEIVGNFAIRMLKAAGLDWQVNFYDNYDCIQNAHYVMTQIRVGRLPARILDEKIPLKYNLIGQETCGIGGFFKAMRTIPVLKQIAQKIKTTAPDAYMINFTNPSGIIAEALKDSGIKSIGLCNCPYAMEKSVKQSLGLSDAQIQYVGLNHFSWLTAITSKGKDYIKDAIQSGVNSAAMKNIPANGFDKDVLKTVGGIPSTYLEYYYFKQQKLKKLQSEELCRGEVCQKLEQSLLEKYKDVSLDKKPEELELRGGAYYSEVAVSLLEAIENDRKTRHIINVKNKGALDFLDNDDIVEIPAIVGKDKIQPIAVEGFDNAHIIAMMKMMKDYERAVVVAAQTGKKDDAVRALMLNPLGGDYNAVSQCYDELRLLNSQYLKSAD